MNRTPDTDPSAEPSPEQILHDLNRPVPDAPGSGVVGALLVSAVTFGLAPAVLWPIGWRAFVAAERRQYLALASWLRRHTAHPNAGNVHGYAKALRPVPLLSALPITCAALFGVFVVVLALEVGQLFEHLLESTYYYAPSAYLKRLGGGDAGIDMAAALFWAWVGLLSVAFACHWLQVQLHAWRVRQFLDQFNQIVVDEALSPVFLPPLGVGLRPLWVIGAILLIVNSALWGVPMAMAGAVQRNYTRTAGPAMRAALAARLRDLMLLHRGPATPWMQAPVAAAVSAAVPQRLRCETPGCRLPLPAGARFCPRCGNQAVAPLDRVA